MRNTSGRAARPEPERAPRRGLTPHDLRFTPPSLDEALVADFVQRRWGLQGSFSRLSGERDQNFRLRLANGASHVVKIASPLEDPVLVDYQVRALQHVAERERDLPTPRIMRATNGQSVCELVSPAGQAHAVRVLSWVPGAPLGSMPTLTPGAVRGTGRLQGRLCRALADFRHPAQDHFMPWDALNGLVESAALRHGYMPRELERRCAPHLERLADVSLPEMRMLPAQVIHNDAHRGNILCDLEDPSTVTGLIDFGDLAFRPVITDLATSLTSFIGHTDDPLSLAATLVEGFRSVTPIDGTQLELLYDALLARAILSVQLLSYRVQQTAAPESVRTVDLAESRVNLEVALSVDPERFFRAVSA